MTVLAEINGSIQVKSYLQGNSEIQLSLNPNIILGRDSEITGSLYFKKQVNQSINQNDTGS